MDEDREPLLHRVGATRAEAVAVAVLVAGVLACLGLVWTLGARRAAEAPAGAALGAIATAPALTGPGATAPAQAGPGATGSALAGPGAEGSSAAGPGAGAGPSPAPAADLVVHVAGAVSRPGVYRVPAGARIAEAVEAAGGALPEAQLHGLNLARAVADGEQVLVPGPGVPPPAPAPDPVPSGGPSGALVDLNTATAADLDALPGVGPVLAARILEHRDRVGGFTRVDELADVKGIGDATFAELAPLVTV